MSFLGRYYRTYALDFWGFGESGKKRETYAVQDFVSLVDQFMEQLGIANAPLVGHSMGGTVSLSVAIKYPQRVSKVVVVGSPIVGSSLALPLKLAGYRPIAFMLFNMMGAFRLAMKVASPIICRDERFADMMDRDLSQHHSRILPAFDCLAAPDRSAPDARADQGPCHGDVWRPRCDCPPKAMGADEKGNRACTDRAVPVCRVISSCWKSLKDFAQRLKSFLDVKEPIPAPQTIHISISNSFRDLMIYGYAVLLSKSNGEDHPLIHGRGDRTQWDQCGS